MHLNELKALHVSEVLKQAEELEIVKTRGLLESFLSRAPSVLNGAKSAFVIHDEITPRTYGSNKNGTNHTITR